MKFCEIEKMSRGRRITVRRGRLTWTVAWLVAFVIVGGAGVPQKAACAAEAPLPGDAWPAPSPLPSFVPGQAYAPPTAAADVAADAPVIFEHTVDAGPDQSFFAVGKGLADQWIAWGRSAQSPGGQFWPLKTQFANDRYAAATIPERAFDGPMIVWARNGARASRPIRLNVPQPWWCRVEQVKTEQFVRVFGRDLAQRPDNAAAWVYLARPGQYGHWLPIVTAAKYHVRARLPEKLEPGEYQLWVHAGQGGALGWGEPVVVRIAPPRAPAGGSEVVSPGPDVRLQEALERMAAAGGGEVLLCAGLYRTSGTLRVPAGVRLRGAGAAATRVQWDVDPRGRFEAPGRNAWNEGPGAIHTPGDELEYRVRFPSPGEYRVFVRYATEMKPYGMDGVSGRFSLRLGDADPITLDNLPNTGSFGTFRWALSGKIRVPAAGEHRLLWRNEKGGGINLDAFVFTIDDAFEPSDRPFPVEGPKTVIVQGEHVERMASKEGTLPRGDAAAVWLCGNDAAIEDLTIAGSSQTNIGIVLGQADALRPLERCSVQRVRVVDIEGKQGENCGVKLINAAGCTVKDCELRGRAPLFLFGAVDCDFVGNRLVPVTRFGGNAEAVILGRCQQIERCLIEGNLIASPPGADAGGPTGRRLLWFSTGRGSVVHNVIACNGVVPALGPAGRVGDDGAGQPRFGGVAGTDQNVGEMILFEANHRTMYFGRAAGADAQSITLPETLEPTPDDRLGSVKRDQLAHDAHGRETPFWPPDDFDETEEPPIHQYFVTVFDGRGQGQTRRVLGRQGPRLLLDRPWRTEPDGESVIAVGTMFYRNLIVENHTPDGMTGIQLWISCVENVVSGNTIARQRKPGLFLYASGSTLASSMPRTWNRGITPLFFNHVEGNRTDECSVGALVTSGDAGNLPIEFPRALGNLLRHNSLVRSRTDGVLVSGRPARPESPDRSSAVCGTIVEFNVARDAQNGYRLGGGDCSLVRRNHAYFWYPVAFGENKPAGVAVDYPGLTAAIEWNSVEGIHGTGDAKIPEVKRPQTPSPGAKP